MDIRRLSLWEGRNATYMSNEAFSAIIEDQGEVVVELSNEVRSNVRISPLLLPYFRSTGSSVEEDVNRQWWQSKQGLYQAGGAYFNFPFNSENILNTTNASWILRKYGTENETHGVWKYSAMISREEGNRYSIGKVDLIIPGQSVLYTAIKITNTGSEPLKGTPSWNTVLSYPLVETGAIINTNARFFTVYELLRREMGRNRYKEGVVFDDIKHMLTVDSNPVDGSLVPPPTGTYDYMLGKLPLDERVGWISVMNPRSKLIHLLFAANDQRPNEYAFPNVLIGQNYYGRSDAPWALFDGASPQVLSLTVGFNSGPRGTMNFSLMPGESRTLFIGNSFSSFENPRLSMGFYVNEVSEKGFSLRRTKSSHFIAADTEFRAIRKLSKRVFLSDAESMA